MELSVGNDRIQQPAARARGLRKSFGAVEVLKDASFDVAPGEIVCVWGPSGAGKSTLLHVLGLMTPPSGGTLEIFGQDAAGRTEDEQARTRNERIGFLFQFHHLLPDLSLLENVMMPLLIRREPPEQAREKSKALLEKLGLGARLGHRPSEASGGEQQRAALARALAGSPGLLLADEPTGNLDRAAGREVEVLLKSEAKSRGAAVVLVTHNEELAAQADRRLTLVDGVLKSA
ncbi:MAG: ABC transporter ATP-binding protein [Elusimicrobiota bacterium]